MFASTYLHEDVPAFSTEYDSWERASENDSDIWTRKPHENLARRELAKLSRAVIEGSSTSLVEATKLSFSESGVFDSGDTWPGTLPSTGSTQSSWSSTYNRNLSSCSPQLARNLFDVAMLDGSPCFCVAGAAINPIPREEGMPKRRQLHDRYTSIPTRIMDTPLEETFQIKIYAVDIKKKHELIRAKWTYKPTRASVLRDSSLCKKYKYKKKTVCLRNSFTQTDANIEAVMKKYASLMS